MLLFLHLKVLGHLIESLDLLLIAGEGMVADEIGTQTCTRWQMPPLTDLL